MRGLGDQIAIERHRAAGVVIAGNGVGDAVRIGVGIEDGRDRNIEPARFLDGDGFLVGVDHEQQVGHAAHVLDAAERALQLVALALHGQAFFLGEPPDSPELSISSSLRRREIEPEMVCQLVSVPPSQRD